MRVLGVDPGLTRCGLAVVEGSLGRPLAMRHVEVLTTKAGQPLPERLLLVSCRVRDLIESTQPDVMAVERMFSQHNLHTVMGTAQASAAAVLAAAEVGVPVVWHTPTEVKAAVTGNGRADKTQVAGMVVRILDLSIRPTPVDATDALALAICHVWRGGAADRIAQAAAGAPKSRIPTRAAAKGRQVATRAASPAGAAATTPSESAGRMAGPGRVAVTGRIPVTGRAASTGVRGVVR